MIKYELYIPNNNTKTLSLIEPVESILRLDDKYENNKRITLYFDNDLQEGSSKHYGLFVSLNMLKAFLKDFNYD